MKTSFCAGSWDCGATFAVLGLTAVEALGIAVRRGGGSLDAIGFDFMGDCNFGDGNEDCALPAIVSFREFEQRRY